MNIQEFFNKNKVIGLTEEFAISNRICDEKGEPLKFKAKAITSKEYEDLRDKNMKINPISNTYKFNSAGFGIDLITKCCVEPNFKDKASIDSLGVATAEDYINAVLLPGEIDALVQKITQVNGYKPFNELVEDAKN